MRNPAKSDPYTPLFISEVSEFLRISDSTTGRLISDEYLPARKIRRQAVISRNDLIDYLEKGTCCV